MRCSKENWLGFRASSLTSHALRCKHTILVGTLLQLWLLFYADSPNKSRTSQADCIGTYSTGPRKSSVFGNWRIAVCGRGAPAPLPLLHCCTHAAALRGSHVKLCTFKVFIIFPVCTSCPGGAAAGSRHTTGWGGQLGVCKAAPSVFRLPTGAAPAERTTYDTVAIQKIHHEKSCCWCQHQLFNLRLSSHHVTPIAGRVA